MYQLLLPYVTGSNLIVRRGSEPVLNVITVAPQTNNSSLPRHSHLTKRWSGNLHLNDKVAIRSQ